jgi:ankyrin repeat protein
MRRKLLGGLAATAMMFASAALAADTRLVDAVQNGDTSAVKSLLQQKVDVNAATSDGTTALHWAAQRGDVETVKALLAAGANAKAVNRYGVTPLAEASANATGPIAGLLLKAGADPNSASAEGETAVMTAAHSGNLEAIKALVAAGANVNAKDGYRGQTALMWAAGTGRPEIVRYLAAHGAELNAHSLSRGDPPKGGGGGAPLAHGGSTALLFAARQGDMESVKILTEAGAGLNEQDADGSTALVLATINTHYDIAAYLLDKGADPNRADKDGRTPLYAAADMHSLDTSVIPARKEADKLTSMELIKLLVEHKANVNAQLKGKVGGKAYLDGGDTTLNAGTTPFVRAARGADLEVMHFLVDHGANPNLTLDDKNTAIMIAAGIGYREGKTHGSEADAIEAIKYCVSLGGDINAASDRGDTALHGAANRGANDLVRFLVAQGAKLEVKNKQGLTPYDIAIGLGGQGGIRNPHLDTAEVIKQFLDKAPQKSAQNTSKE